jgi:hypothetical protein
VNSEGFDSALLLSTSFKAIILASILLVLPWFCLLKAYKDTDSGITRPGDFFTSNLQRLLPFPFNSRLQVQRLNVVKHQTKGDIYLKTI